MRYPAAVLVAFVGCSTATPPPARPAEPRSPAPQARLLPSADETGPFKVGGDVIAPVLTKRVPPQYPEEARKAKISGRVVFQVVISESGTVESLDLIDSDSPLLTGAAEDSLRQWRYQPATKGGRPVRVFAVVTVTFNLR